MAEKDVRNVSFDLFFPNGDFWPLFTRDVDVTDADEMLITAVDAAEFYRNNFWADEDAEDPIERTNQHWEIAPSYRDDNEDFVDLDPWTFWELGVS